MANTYQVKKQGRNYVVAGLKEELGDDPDTTLVLMGRFPATETPEALDIDDKQSMHDALYDLFQCHDGLKDGDRFETEFGAFECRHIHVVAV